MILQLSEITEYPYHHYLSALSRKISNLTECCALRDISARHLTSAHEGRMSNSVKEGCISCCRHTISVMPMKARNRYIIMPKQAICRSSSCCRHIYSIKAQCGRIRHMKYAHAGFMSNRQWLWTSMSANAQSG